MGGCQSSDSDEDHRHAGDGKDGSGDTALERTLLHIVRWLVAVSGRENNPNPDPNPLSFHFCIAAYLLKGISCLPGISTPDIQSSIMWSVAAICMQPYRIGV